ncbi:hypothetical protein C1703_30630 [Streptomyces sp. Go-475]|nr:hypothetical protein C1703_30630 [Streptomyces sp. Go-475]
MARLADSCDALTAYIKAVERVGEHFPPFDGTGM